ncbi:MAG: biopolymer transporter ExbD [Pirellulaceae bacterium]|nr:biopolymer transporter ExbD [Planctomycetaceae bacterium]
MPIKTHADEQPTLNLTPMIDIIFLLVIFFMVGTKFAEAERNVDVRLPQVESSQAPRTPPKRHIVTVAADGQILWDGHAVTVRELRGQLQRTRDVEGVVRVVLRGDGNSPYRNVAAVLNACRDEGVDELGMSVRLASRIRE